MLTATRRVQPTTTVASTRLRKGSNAFAIVALSAAHSWCKAYIAPIATRTDWLERAWRPGLIDCNETLRKKVAEHWARVALMEHASVAACPFDRGTAHFEGRC